MASPLPDTYPEGAAFYYQWLGGGEYEYSYENDSGGGGSARGVSDATARELHGEPQQRQQPRQPPTALLKKDITVLSIGQLRNIICELIDLTEDSSGGTAGSFANVNRTTISTLVGREISRLRSASNVHWNARFQEALESKSNNDLTNLGNDFSFTANLYAQVLIMEKNLPMWQKTILPVEIGGFAGGTKYIVHGIVFKFASDESAIYGSYHNAAKAVGSELRHAAAIREAAGSKLSVPIGVSIDWYGHRLSATSLLPLKGRSSLVHGSNDAGRRIFDGSSDQKCLDVMAKLGNNLGLRKHLVRNPSETNNNNNNLCALIGPTDMEIHRADDDRLYALDCHRLYPCEAPVRSLRPLKSSWPRCGHLIRLLRPEFIKAYSHAKQIFFSSDAFSKFAAPNESMLDAKQVREATRFLILKHIPAFAAHLDRDWVNNSTRRCDHAVDAPNNPTAQDLRPRAMFGFLSSLRNDAHGHGINMRLLGYVRRACKVPVVRALLLVEMLARTAKANIRKALRQTMSSSEILPSGSSLRSSVVTHLNLLLGTGQSSRDYWESDLRTNLESKFEFSTLDLSGSSAATPAADAAADASAAPAAPPVVSLAEDPGKTKSTTEGGSSYTSIRSLKVHLIVALQTRSRRLFLKSLLWVRLQEMIGIDVLPRTHHELLNEDSPYLNDGGSASRGVLLESEIISIGSRLKAPPVLSRAAAHMLLQHATTVSRRKMFVVDQLPPLPSSGAPALRARSSEPAHSSTRKRNPIQNWQAARLFRLASFKALQSLDRAPTSVDGLSLLGETQLREAAQTLHTGAALRLLESAHVLLSEARERAAGSLDASSQLFLSPGVTTTTTTTHASNKAGAASRGARPSLTGLSGRCALLAAVAKVRLACIGHESLESKRQLLLDACFVLGSRTVEQWMEADSEQKVDSLELDSADSEESKFFFTNDITAASKIALEHLLALFHLGCLEAGDHFFADSGMARLHKALGVLRLGGSTPLRKTPIGLLLESHIRDVIGILSTPCLQVATKSASINGPILLLNPTASRPAAAIITTNDTSCGVFPFVKLARTVFHVQKRNSHGENKIAGPRALSSSPLTGSSTAPKNTLPILGPSPVFSVNCRAKISCMCLMHGERILVCANKKQEMLFVDLLDAKGKIRNKVITGTGEEITVLAAHEEVLAVGTGNGLIRVLTVRGGKHLNRTGLPLPVRIDLVLTGHSSNVMTIDLQSGGHLISGGVDRSVRVWDLTSGALILSLTRRWPGWGPIYSIALLAAPLGTRCAIREETEVEAKDDVAIKRSASVTSIAPIIADDGTGNMSSHSSSMGRGNLSLVRRKRAVAVSSGDGGLRLWDMSSLIRHDGGSVLGVDGAGGSDSDGHGHRAYSFSSSRSRGDEGLGSQFSSCSRVLIEPGTNPLSGKDHPVVVTQLIEVDHTNLLATGDTKGIVCVWDEISWVKLLSVQVHPTAIASLSVRRIIGSVQQHSSDDLGSGLDEKGIRSRETAEDILAVLSNGVGGAQASVMNFFKLSL